MDNLLTFLWLWVGFSLGGFILAVLKYRDKNIPTLFVLLSFGIGGFFLILGGILKGISFFK